MTVVGLHPEQLIDRLEAGSLNDAERAQLDAHLAMCETCRIELATRADFAGDAPLAFPEQPALMLEAPELEPPSARRRSTPAARRSNRRRLALLVIAASLSASGALAALSNRQLPWRIWFRESVSAVTGAAGAKPPVSKGPAKRKSLAAAAPASPAPSASEAALDNAVSAEAPAELAPPVLDPAPARSAERVQPLLALERAKAASACEATEVPTGQAAFPAVAAGTPEPADVSASEAALLFAEASRARRDGNTGRATTLYRQLQHDYPSSPESQLSIALLAKIMLDRGDPAAAAADYDRYLQAGTPVLSAEALVGRARALERLAQLDAAAAAWREVQQRFPGTVHARLAATRLAALGGR